MNYLDQIRGFWRSHEEHSFSSTEIALYFHLLEVCNICQWKNPFRRNNAKIRADLGISYNTLKNARNRLSQAGLISFKTLNGSPNVTYTLSKFDKVSIEVKVEVSNEVSNEVGDKVFTTKDKLNINKTKQSKSHSSAKANVKKKTELVFWKEFIGVWNNFYLKKLENEYNYMAKDFGSFKKIYGFLKKRIETKKRNFSEENLMETFKWFLEKAWEKDEWLRQNFTVSNVLSQFNQIVNESKTNQHGKSNGGQRGNGSGKLSGRATINPDEDIQEFA